MPSNPTPPAPSDAPAVTLRWEMPDPEIDFDRSIAWLGDIQVAEIWQQKYGSLAGRWRARCVSYICRADAMSSFDTEAAAKSAAERAVAEWLQRAGLRQEGGE